MNLLKNFRRKKDESNPKSEKHKFSFFGKVFVGALAVITLVSSLLTPTKSPVFAAFNLPYRNVNVNYYIIGDDVFPNIQSPIIYCPDGVTPAYCVQPYVYYLWERSFYESGSLDSATNISTAEKQRIATLSYFGYGYTGRTDDLWYYGTQLAIWRVVAPGIEAHFGPVGNNYGQYDSQIYAMANQVAADADAYYDKVLKKYQVTWKVLDSDGNLVIQNYTGATELELFVGETYTFIDTNGIADQCTLTRNDYGSRFKKVSANTYELTLDDTDFENTRKIEFTPPSSQLSARGLNLVYNSTNGHQRFVSLATPSAATIRALYGDTDEDGGDDTTWRLLPKSPLLSVIKTDEAGNGLAGASLSLYKINGSSETLINSWISTTEYTTPIKVDPGKYRLVENSSPKGYYPNEAGVTFTVEDVKKDNSNRIQYTSISNEEIKARVKKIDSVDGTPVIGATLQLLDGSDTVLETWVTDGNDHILDTSKFEAGSFYKIKEVATPAGYYLNNQEIYFQIPYHASDSGIDSEGYVTIDVENIAIDYQVEKVDAYTQDPVVGAKLQLIGQGNTVLEEWTTDGTPHKLDKTNLKVGQSYAIREVEAPNGYYSMASDVTFKVDAMYAGSTYTVHCEDKPIVYNLNKTGSDGGTIAGAVLALYDSDGNLVDQWTSTTSGHVMRGLKEGETYTLMEISGPAGYYPTTAPMEFTVTKQNEDQQGNVIDVNFTNYEIEFYVDKIDASTKKRLAGVEIMVQTEEGIDIGSVITRDDESVLIPHEYLEAGKTYRLHEVSAVDGYYYPEEDVIFTVPSTYEEAKSMKKSYFTETVTDKKIKYAIVKLNEETGAYVPGAMLGIYSDEAGTDLLYSWTTTEEPFVISDYITLKAGTSYYVREIKNPNGYFLNESAVEIFVPYSVTTNETIKATFMNIPIHWNIKKVDENGDLLTTTLNKSSCILEVYDTNETFDEWGDDTLIATLDTADKTYAATEYFDMQDYIDQGLVQGGKHYRIHEKQTPLGYQLTEDTIVEIANTGTTSTILSSVVNEAIEVHFRKVDENGNLLTKYSTLTDGDKGFIIGIYDEELLNAGDPNALILTIDTSDADYVANGYADIGAYLSVQKTYVAKEIEQPFGYYKAKDYVFQVDTLPKTGDVYELVMTDPTIKVQFRKEDSIGTVLTTVDGESFEFQVIDDETGEVVGTIYSSDGEGQPGGWIQIGQWMQEGRTYRIHETYAPGQYKYSTEDVMITVPGYYVEAAGNVINVKVSDK